MAKKRPSGDGLVRKRSDGRWEGRIVAGHKEDGKPIFRSVFARTQRELMDKLHNQIELHRDVELTEGYNLTLSQWLDKWLAEYKTYTVREKTLQGYSSLGDHYIKPYLGDKKLSAITTAATGGKPRLIIRGAANAAGVPKPAAPSIKDTNKNPTITACTRASGLIERKPLLMATIPPDIFSVFITKTAPKMMISTSMELKNPATV